MQLLQRSILTESEVNEGRALCGTISSGIDRSSFISSSTHNEQKGTKKKTENAEFQRLTELFINFWNKVGFISFCSSSIRERELT